MTSFSGIEQSERLKQEVGRYLTPTPQGEKKRIQEAKIKGFNILI